MLLIGKTLFKWCIFRNKEVYSLTLIFNWNFLQDLIFIFYDLIYETTQFQNAVPGSAKVAQRGVEVHNQQREQHSSVSDNKSKTQWTKTFA